MTNCKSRAVSAVIKALLLVTLLLCLAGCKSYFEVLSMIDSGKCGEKLTWTLNENGVLTIKGNGYMDTFNENAEEFPWYNNRDKITKLIVKNGVSSIEKNAFSDCKNLAEITIPNSVKRIGKNAFSDCEKLKDVHYTGTLQEWKSIINGEPEILLPKQIEKESYEKILRGWSDKDGREYRLFVSYYTLKNPFSYSASSPVVADMKAQYPATEKYAIYVLDLGITNREMLMLEGYLKNNTNYNMKQMLKDYDLIDYIDELSDINVELKKAKIHLTELAD